MIAVYQQENLDLYSFVETTINEALHITAKDEGYFSLPHHTFNPLRQQYDAMSILTDIADKYPDGEDLRLGIVKVDLYTSGMNFIFGLADPLQHTALVSTHRLAGSTMRERLAKEIVHELGHLIGLQHCSDSKCVMYFSNTIEDTDSKSHQFCALCGRKLA